MRILCSKLSPGLSRPLIFAEAVVLTTHYIAYRSHRMKSA